MFEDKEEKHPAFGMMSFTRIQCSHGQTLHGSDLQHSTLIQMDLRHGIKRRGLSHDWYHATDLIASVTMSQNQFSELITSMNMGDGIPVTLTRTQADGEIEPPEFSSFVETHKEEFKERTKVVSQDAADLLSTMQELLAGSGTVKKADRETMLNQAEKVLRELGSNLPYVEDCFKESMDKVVTEAKSTINAYYTHQIVETGVAALAGVKPESPKLIEDSE